MTEPDGRWSGRPAPSMLDKDPETLASHLLEPATMRAVYDECRDVLGQAPDGPAVLDAAWRAVQIAEGLWSDLEAEGPGYDCRLGCSWCCHQTVMVTAPEVFVVVDHLRRTLEATALAELTDRLAERSDAIRGKTTGERMAGRVACGFLDAGACSVHAARPLPCRGGFSRDAAFCEALFGDHAATVEAVAEGRREGPFLVVPKTIFNSAQVGTVTALREIGYTCRPLELTAAMAIALAHDDIIGTWLSDESVFAPAELHSVGGHYVTSAAHPSP